MRPYTTRAAKYYDFLVYDEVKRAPKEVKFFKELLGKKVKRILDVACGTGRLSIPLAKAGYIVTGIDITPEMLDVARSKNKGKNPKFIKANMLTYKSKSKFGAAVCGSNTLTHLHRKKDVLKCFNNLRKNLKNNGVLIFDVWNTKNWGKGYKIKKTISEGNTKVKYVEVGKIDTKRRYHWWKDTAEIIDDGKKLKLSFGGRLHYRLNDEWKELLEKSGFRDIRIIKGKIYKNKIYFVARR